MPKFYRKKTERKRRSRKNRELSLENLKLPSYEKVRSDIEKKIGRRVPRLSKNLPKGRWTKQALRVLEERYLVKDGRGKVVESPEEMCWRVSWEVASAETRWGKGKREVTSVAKEFYEALVSRKFLPNSPTLMNAGTGNMLQYSGCFVLPVEDSIEGIFDAVKYQALVHKSGGGTGFSFSRLRPRGSMVKSSSGIASGPVSFMRIFDAATNEVKQGGRRRGANMGVLRVDHPDITEFISCKEDGGITNFNISVAITNKFMKAYEKNKNYDLIDPRTKKNVGRLSARKVFDKIAESAWRTGDPGMVFIDRRNRGSSNPVPSLGPIEATNPCGEQELYPFGVCNLGSIFLNYFVKEMDGAKEVDWEGLKEMTRIAVRFLDNVIEVNPYPLPQIRQIALGIRRIGLGIGGWADMLIELGVPYDSEKALKLGGKIMETIQKEAVKTSQLFAKERGPFPLWPVSIYKNSKPRRNSTVTTIAPTGSISIIASASSGIEPLYAIAYQHIVKDRRLKRTLTFVNPTFEKMAEEGGFWSDEIKKKILENGTVEHLEGVPRDVRAVFRTAHEIHQSWHIKMQSAFQKYTENAVSKTVNMRNGVSANDVKNAYLLAWKAGCKGVTVFRDGCKEAQVLNLGTKSKESKDSTLIRPFKVTGATYRLNSPIGTAFVTINQDENREPLEVFINVGKAGSDVTAVAEALGRTISTALRFRGHLSPRERAKEIAQQLSGIGGRRSVGFGANKIRSLPDAIAVALSSHFGFKINGNGSLIAEKYTDGETGATSDVARAVMEAEGSGPSGLEQAHSVSHNDPTAAQAASGAAPVPFEDNQLLNEVSGQLQMQATEVFGDICPSCGASSLVYEEGCSKCYSCAYSEC